MTHAVIPGTVLTLAEALAGRAEHSSTNEKRTGPRHPSSRSERELLLKDPWPQFYPPARVRAYAHRENLAYTQIDLGARARAGELSSAS